MRWNGIRNVLLFFGGLLGVLHETLTNHGERPTLLLLFAAMMGIAVGLHRNGK